MTTNRKGRAGWHQSTLNTSKRTSESTRLAARNKAVIVILALCGLLPVTVADWLIHRGGLRDD